MKTVGPRYFALFVDDHVSHAHALLGVARRLRAAGHEVEFLGPGGAADPIVDEGFRYQVHDFLAPVVGPPCTVPQVRARGRCKAAVRARAARILVRFEELVTRRRPDLAIFDPFLLCHYPALWRLRVPAVAVSTKPLLDRDALVPPYTSDVVPPRSVGLGSTRVVLAWGRQYLEYGRYRGHCRVHESLHGWSHRSLTVAIARAAGFPFEREWATRPSSWDLRFESVPELVLHARELDFPRARELSHSGYYIGPCTDLPERAVLSELPGGDGPLIYCHLGSVPSQRSSRVLEDYRAVIEAVRREPSWRLLLSTGAHDLTQPLAREVRSFSHRATITDWLPRAAALAHTQVVIAHGGSNSVKEAIMAGCPMLLMPRAADQPGVTARVVYHGLGLRGAADGATVQDQLRRLLDDRRFASRVRAMQETFLEYDRQRVCERVLEWTATGGPLRFSQGLPPTRSRGEPLRSNA